MKRVFDIVGAFLGLVLFFPLFMVVALAIKLSSPGPVFFKQERLGRNFRPFWIYKFRTMRQRAMRTTGAAIVSSLVTID